MSFHFEMVNGPFVRMSAICPFGVHVPKSYINGQHEITNPNQHDGAQPPCLQTQKQMNSVVVRSNWCWHMIDGLSEWYAQNEVMKQNSE